MPSPVREVVDADGTRWRVMERPASHVPGARGEYCLLCESEKVCRRIWVYPQNWHLLPSGELLAICEHPRRADAA